MLLWCYDLPINSIGRPVIKAPGTPWVAIKPHKTLICQQVWKNYSIWRGTHSFELRRGPWTGFSITAKLSYKLKMSYAWNLYFIFYWVWTILLKCCGRSSFLTPNKPANSLTSWYQPRSTAFSWKQTRPVKTNSRFFGYHNTQAKTHGFSFSKLQNKNNNFSVLRLF